MNSCSALVICPKPEGAFYAYPQVQLKNTDSHFISELIRATGVVVVPGTGFGQKPGTKHFRVVFLPQEEVLEKAYKNIGTFYAKYKNEFE